MTSSDFLLLSARSRADFYQGLGRLLAAGIPADQALTTLIDPQQPELATAIEQTARQLARGKPLYIAGKQQGLIQNHDLGIIQAGEDSGGLVTVVQALAEQYESQAKRTARFKSRMILPAIVLIIGVLVTPVPQLFGGTLDTTGYLLQTLLPLVLIFIAIYLLVGNHVRSHARGKTSLLASALNLFPPGKTLALETNRLYFLERLSLYIQCGVDAERAFTQITGSISHPVYRSQYRTALTSLRSGKNISDSLQAAGILDGSSDYPIISAGEAAGKLEDSLLRRSDWHRQQLEQQYDLIAEWAPRIIYVIVAGWFVLGMII